MPFNTFFQILLTENFCYQWENRGFYRTYFCGKDILYNGEVFQWWALFLSLPYITHGNFQQF